MSNNKQLINYKTNLIDATITMRSGAEVIGVGKGYAPNSYYLIAIEDIDVTETEERRFIQVVNNDCITSIQLPDDSHKFIGLFDLGGGDSNMIFECGLLHDMGGIS
jgi:hypothetical protein